MIPCGLVLGNFDGVHRGHLALIQELKHQNEISGNRLALGAFCFERHPFFSFGKPISLLCSNEEKLELFRRAGLQFVILGDFDDLKDLSPEEFVCEFLWERCNCRMAVCGFNYSFGKKGAGKPEDLVRLFEARGSGIVSVVPPVTDGGSSVSSTVIRALVESGKPEDAARLLGRPFSLRSVPKDCFCIENGVSMVIVEFSQECVVPAEGFYVIESKIENTLCKAIGYVKGRTCRVYVNMHPGEWRGKTSEFLFLHFLGEGSRSAENCQAANRVALEYLDNIKAFF